MDGRAWCDRVPDERQEAVTGGVCHIRSATTFPKYAVTGLMAKLPAHGQLDLLVDCPSAPDDVPKVAQAAGCAGTTTETLGAGEWRIAIRT
jgi:TusA-related sulfurtransferase